MHGRDSPEDTNTLCYSNTASLVHMTLFGIKEVADSRRRYQHRTPGHALQLPAAPGSSSLQNALRYNKHPFFGL